MDAAAVDLENGVFEWEKIFRFLSSCQFVRP